jgi:hypothetical protein
VINFLEVFQITFAIYSENTEYNLVQVASQVNGLEPFATQKRSRGLETFRIFSQTLESSLQPLSEAGPGSESDLSSTPKFDPESGAAPPFNP